LISIHALSCCFGGCIILGFPHFPILVSTPCYLAFPLFADSVWFCFEFVRVVEIRGAVLNHLLLTFGMSE
jgi:hypothetical protein